MPETLPEPAVPAPVGLLEQTLQQLPAEAQQRLRPHLQALTTQCALEQRRYASGATAWRLRFRIPGPDGRKRQFSVVVKSEELAKRLFAVLHQHRQQEDARRQEARQQDQDTTQRTREALQRGRELRLRFESMVKGQANRMARSAAWRQLLENGLLMADPDQAQAMLYAAAQQLKSESPGVPRNGRRPSAGDLLQADHDFFKNTLSETPVPSQDVPANGVPSLEDRLQVMRESLGL